MIQVAITVRPSLKDLGRYDVLGPWRPGHTSLDSLHMFAVSHRDAAERFIRFFWTEGKEIPEKWVITEAYLPRSTAHVYIVRFE